MDILINNICYAINSSQYYQYGHIRHTSIHTKIHSLQMVSNHKPFIETNNAGN